MNNLQDFFTGIRQKRAGDILFRYLKDGEVQDIDCETFFDQVDHIASGLCQLGMQGKRIAVIGPTCYEWIVTYFSVLSIGSIVMGFNKDYSPEEIREACDFTDADAVVYHSSVQQKVEQAAEGTQLMLISMQPTRQAGRLDLQALQDMPFQPFASGATWDSPAAMLFTSGTTGRSKAVILSHRNLYAASEAFAQSKGCAKEVYLLILPLHHIAAQINPITKINKPDTTVCFCDSMQRLTACLNIFHPNRMFATPAMLQAMLPRVRRAEDPKTVFGGEMEFFDTGSAMLTPELAREYTQRGFSIVNFYGMTELAGMGTEARLTPDSTHTSGKPQACLECRIEDSEILFRGDVVMTGYYKDEQSTREALQDGWYHTGDVGYIDDEGNVRITGRRKNLIILSNGENVSPEEIENKLMAEPQIAEAVVYGEADRICADIYPEGCDACSAGELEEIQQQIRALVKRYNRTVPTYKMVHKVKFRDTPFPKNSTGKIVRREFSYE